MRRRMRRKLRKKRRRLLPLPLLMVAKKRKKKRKRERKRREKESCWTSHNDNEINKPLLLDFYLFVEPRLITAHQPQSTTETGTLNAAM
ncbi:MAG: hypothetical protein ACXV2C_00080 [Candidatus Bathyarchaeia archaeon]